MILRPTRSYLPDTVFPVRRRFRSVRLMPSTFACAQRSARWLRVSGAASVCWPVGSLGAFMPAIVLQARVRRILGHGTSGDKRARARKERGAQGPVRTLESPHHDLLLIVTSSPCLPTSMKTAARMGWALA